MQITRDEFDLQIICKMIRTNELLYLAISKRNTTAETWLASCNDPIHTFWNSQFSEAFQNRNEYLNSEKFRIEIECLHLISKKSEIFQKTEIRSRWL